MNRKLILLVGAGVVAAVALTFQPFMVIDRAEPTTRHTPLGHHPIWDPPTTAEAGEVLTRRVGPPSEGAATALDVEVNTVMLVFEFLLIVAVTVVLWFVLGRFKTRVKRVAET